jgi:DNA-binding response OmpR family regulator
MPTRKVLIVDRSSDRKKRISAVRERGFAVFPALQLQDACSRCRAGAYDLVVVSGTENFEAALAFCQQLQGRNPPQAVLLVTSNGSEAARDYVVSGSPEALADRVEKILRKSQDTTDSADDPSQQPPSRAVA